MFSSYYILESEADTINNIQRLMREYQEFNCVGVSNDLGESMNCILKYVPDIVFINIDHIGNSINQDMFSYCKEINKYTQKTPFFIALSSCESKAYQAIKNKFYDYILKPVNELEIRKTVLQLLKRPKPFLKDVLCLKSYKDFTLLEIEDILYLKADNNSTDFILLDGCKVSAFKTLKTFESVLPSNFLRIHHSYIVNKNYISRINFGKSQCFLKNSKNCLPFSKSYRHNLDDFENLLLKKAIAFN